MDSTLVFVEGNLSRMTVFLVTDIQQESYPSARFQHFTDLMKGKHFTTANRLSPFDDRGSDSLKTTIIKI